MVVSMVASRRVREWLGFSWERCMQRKVPPCPLASLDATFVTRLHGLYPRLPTDVYKQDRQLIVSLVYHEDEEVIELNVLNNVALVRDETRGVTLWTYNERRSYVIQRFAQGVIALVPQRGTKVYRVVPLDE